MHKTDKLCEANCKKPMGKTAKDKTIKKILVTGCAGFIGYHVSNKLLDLGHSVIGIDNINDYYSTELKYARLQKLGIEKKDIKELNFTPGNGQFYFIKADIQDARLYDYLFKNEDIDIVCHLAAQAGVRYSIEAPQKYISSNIEGFFNILEYCRAHPKIKLVFASSSSVYGKNDSVPYRESDKTDRPASLYAATKKANELMAFSYSSLYDIETIGLRLFTVYGPWGRPDMAPFLFTDAIMNGRDIKIFNNGDMFRDFTYIDDITEGICRVLLNKPNRVDIPLFRIYNIGNSEPIALELFVKTIEQISGKQAKKIYMDMQQGDVKATWADTSLLQNDYDYKPTTSIQSGLKSFIEWYKKFY